MAKLPAMRRLDPRDHWSVYHFSQANPAGPGQSDVSALLRRVADSIDARGDIEVQDLVMHTEVTADGDWHSITVYYHRATAGDDRDSGPAD